MASAVAAFTRLTANVPKVGSWVPPAQRSPPRNASAAPLDPGGALANPAKDRPNAATPVLTVADRPAGNPGLEVERRRCGRANRR
eukprot:6040495-Pyramimonas_sp.AAC.1